jgi:putative transposase
MERSGMSNLSLLATENLHEMQYLYHLVKIMEQVITAKLKLHLSSEQKSALREVSLAHRDALNYTSQIAFDNSKTSSGAKLQKLVYQDLRSRFGLPAQMACNVPRQVGATYKAL